MFDFLDDFSPDWDDIALAGAMAEELAEEELERPPRTSPP